VRVQVGELKIAYDEAGSGTPLLLVHGFPHNRTLWRPQLSGLARHFRCIAPDLRGFGESDARGPYTMDRYADDLAGLLDALGIERAAVAGISMGGYITFAFWRRHRARVTALVLANTRAGPDSAEARAGREAMIDLARTRGAAAVADAMIERMVGASTRRRAPELVRAVHAMLASASVEGIVGALTALIHRPDSTPTLPTIDVPTLIVAGEEDAIAPIDEALAMHAAIRGSRLEVIPGAGHLSNLERPATFNAVVSELAAALKR
jgi:3-oxoadipate enol-lactonase